MSAEDEAEIAAHLARAGITPPPGRMAEIAREYAILKQQIALVRAACPADAEPATVFATRPADRESGLPGTSPPRPRARSDGTQSDGSA